MGDTDSGKVQGAIALTIMALSFALGAALYWNGAAWYWVTLACIPGGFLLLIFGFVAYSMFF